MSLIQFETTMIEINSWFIIRLPLDASNRLPSNGLVTVRSSLNHIEFNSPLEPDGWGSHWFRVDGKLKLATSIDVGDTVFVKMTPLDKWPEVDVPEDLMLALEASQT